MMKEVVLATNNQGKASELQALLAPIRCIPLSQFKISSIEETGLTFIENAILKARHVSRLTNMPALADDSGLVVSALQGQPGIYSARFAGVDATDADNIAKLLDALKDVPIGQRHAIFYCAIVMLRHAYDPSPIIATGICDGQITRTPSGDQGFGYDPVFYIPAFKCTFAEVNLSVKNTISHRAKALKEFKHLLSLSPPPCS